MSRLTSIKELAKLRHGIEAETLKPDQARVRVCCGTGCLASGAKELADAISDEATAQGIELDVVKTGCQGLCQKGPITVIEPHGYFNQKVKKADAAEIVTKTVMNGFPVSWLLYRESLSTDPVEFMEEVPFYKKQARLVLRHNGKINPTDINQYIAVGGFKALEKMFTSMTPEDVLEEVKKANLRGRGGAGFPAGLKWEHTKKAPGEIKFVIANGDEGDPGAFMDRSIMEGDPYSVLEGMLICAYAINAHNGLVYVRHEYPLAVEHLRAAIGIAEELGLLGENILGSGFDFTVDVREGAGAFVCGESTALVASIEGERGFPRARPPRLSEPGGGVWGHPSNLNNIETYTCVPVIIEKGADYFLGIGTPKSPGTKVFALTGRVKNTGLLEVPMGITLREIIYDIGGGILGDKQLKAIQTGGPSGGCLPADHLDLPVDFDSLHEVGSMMGSGGMVAMDEDDCMVDVAKFFLSFTQSESCGKCPPCRIGTYQMLEILNRITSGEGEEGDIERLEEIGKQVKEGALCGLGESAPNPVLSTIQYFRDEYEEHINEKFCRAKVCNGLGRFRIEKSECILCGLCKDACAFGAVVELRDEFLIEEASCTKCRACYLACPTEAIIVEKQSSKDKTGKKRG